MKVCGKSQDIDRSSSPCVTNFPRGFHFHRDFAISSWKWEIKHVNHEICDIFSFSSTASQRLNPFYTMFSVFGVEQVSCSACSRQREKEYFGHQRKEKIHSITFSGIDFWQLWQALCLEQQEPLFVTSWEPSLMTSLLSKPVEFLEYSFSLPYSQPRGWEQLAALPTTWKQTNCKMEKRSPSYMPSKPSQGIHYH